MKGQRCALWLWYRGDLFRGYQAQVVGPTVQQALARAMGTTGVRSHWAPAGRTDAGVHARMQVASGVRPLEVCLEDWAAEVQRALPDGVGIAAIRRAHPSFHAQWSCAGKAYRYRLALGEVEPQWEPFCWSPSRHPRFPAGSAVDPELLQRALSACTGTHDFIALHAKSSVRKPRTVQAATLCSVGQNRWEVRLAGTGFARYQVRLLVGTCAAVAAGLLPFEALERAIRSAEAIDGIRAPANGLVLWETFYPADRDPFAGAKGLLPVEPPF